MHEIATLEIQVRSTGLEQANQKLRATAGESARAQSAFARVESALGSLDQGAARAAAGLALTGSGAESSRRSLEGLRNTLGSMASGAQQAYESLERTTSSWLQADQRQASLWASQWREASATRLEGQDALWSAQLQDEQRYQAQSLAVHRDALAAKLAYYRQFQTDWGLLTADMLTATESAFSHTFRGVLKGELNTLGEAFSDLGDQVLDSWADLIGQMLAKWSMSQLAQGLNLELGLEAGGLGGLLSGGGGLGSLLGIGGLALGVMGLAGGLNGLWGDDGPSPEEQARQYLQANLAKLNQGASDALTWIDTINQGLKFGDMSLDELNQLYEQLRAQGALEWWQPSPEAVAPYVNDAGKAQRDDIDFWRASTFTQAYEQFSAGGLPPLLAQTWQGLQGFDPQALNWGGEEMSGLAGELVERMERISQEAGKISTRFAASLGPAFASLAGMIDEDLLSGLDQSLGGLDAVGSISQALDLARQSGASALEAQGVALSATAQALANTSGQEDELMASLLERGQAMRELTQDQEYYNRALARMEEMAVGAVASVAQIGASLDWEELLGTDALTASRQALEDAVSGVLTAGELDQEERQGYLELIQSQGSAVEDLAAKMERYQEIEEALREGYRLSSEELDSLVNEGRALAQELGLMEPSQEAMDQQLQNLAAASQALAGPLGQNVADLSQMEQELSAVNQEVEQLIADLAALPANKTVTIHVNYDTQGETPAGFHAGGMVMHQGGLVQGALDRLLITSHGGALPRMHSGGVWPGLAGDEVPAILQRGEFVLSRGDVSRLGGVGQVERLRRSGGQNVNNISVKVELNGSNLDPRQVADAVEAKLAEAANRGLVFGASRRGKVSL